MQRLDIWDDIVRLKDEEGWSFQRIADHFSKSKGSIAKAYHRAKQVEKDPTARHPESKVRLTQDEIQTLKDMAKWWKEQGSNIAGTPPVHPGTPPVHPGTPGGTPEGTPQVHPGVPPGTPSGTPSGTPVVHPTRKKTYILSEDLIAGIREYAERRGITLTEAVNEIVRRGLAE